MKSQVNALLHVLRGLILDAQAAYPELRDDLSKDYERIALTVKDRGLSVFTLDLPSLESNLLRGLETGRLSLEGPLTKRVSKRIQVPILFSGLWLRVFDEDSCLKHEVDVTAVAFLRQLLVLGKKLRIKCSDDRIAAAVGAYHDIESSLRLPTLNWAGDDLGLDLGGAIHGTFEGNLRTGDRYLNDGDFHHPDLLAGASSNEDPTVGRECAQSRHATGVDPLSLHLVQAGDRSVDTVSTTLPLFRACAVEGDVERQRRLDDQWILNRIQQVADTIIGAFDPLNPIDFSASREEEGRGIGFKHGPGAVAERLKRWDKSHFQNWPRKLQGFFPYEYCGTILSHGIRAARPLNHEKASRLICVPKTAKSPRLIAAEPTAHQWCQQLVLGFLFDQCRRLLKGSFIDFRDQSKSGDLVLGASRDRSLATVDLSEASDRLSCWTVERVFRTNTSVLTALHAARTRYLLDEVSAERSFLSLRKFASQGTATTFPVMSLVLLCVALGCSIEDGETVDWGTIWKYSNRVRVFGDDIILPTHGYERLLRALNLLQLKVNVAKSYVNGWFRESCGTDGYMGYDVTPVKPEVVVAGSPASCQAVMDNSNNLFKKGYWNAATVCFDLIPARLRRDIRVVGMHDVGFGGITSFSGGYEHHLTSRWNNSLHRDEVRVWTTLVHTRGIPRDGRTALLDFFASKHSHESPRTVSEYTDVRKTRVGLQWEPTNPDARVPIERGSRARRPRP